MLWSTVRAGTGPGTPGVGTRARALPAMVRDSLTGEYRGTGRSRLAVSAVGLLYLVSPVDVLPELLLPLVGMLDDAVVAAWVAGSLLVATEDYVQWREDPATAHVAGSLAAGGDVTPVTGGDVTPGTGPTTTSVQDGPDHR